MAGIEFGDNKAQQYLTQDNGVASVTVGVSIENWSLYSPLWLPGPQTDDILHLDIPEMVQMGGKS